MRILLLFFILVLFMPAPGVLHGEALANDIHLNARIEIDGKNILLGHLFSGTSSPDRVIAKAPPPGSERVFRSSQLYKIARQHKINWMPVTRNDRVIIETASKPFPKELVHEKIKQALSDQISFPFSDLTVTLNQPVKNFLLPAKGEAFVRVDNISFSPHTGRFKAHLELGSNDGHYRKSLSIAGQAVVMVEGLVLQRAVRRGERLSASDFALEAIPATAKNRSSLTDIAMIRGKIAKRNLKPGQPVLQGDLDLPFLVSKKSLVRITLAMPGIIITSRGVALEEGRIGDVIQVQNSESKKVIEARVNGIQSVSILPFYPQLREEQI